MVFSVTRTRALQGLVTAGGDGIGAGSGSVAHAGFAVIFGPGPHAHCIAVASTHGSGDHQLQLQRHGAYIIITTPPKDFPSAVRIRFLSMQAASSQGRILYTYVRSHPLVHGGLATMAEYCAAL